MNPLLCPQCQTILTPDQNFCPKCGTKIKDAVLSVTMGKQLSIYALSFFLPPLGLWPGIKYLRQNEQSAKRVGIIALVLTVISLILNVWFGIAIYNQYKQTFSSQLNQYQHLGL
ncbi:hypothetical protein BH11PAT1_BH11PAT1_5660 [soil metagenome]